MKYSALSISQYVINHEWDENRPVSNLRLQKLLYFIQACFYASRGYGCFRDKIEAWDFGPVIPSVYRKYKKYGSCIIIDKAANLIKDISDEDKEMIDLILNVSAEFTTTDLVKLSKDQDPWKNAYTPLFENEITEEQMKNYFAF